MDDTLSYWDEVKVPLKRILIKMLYLVQSRKFVVLVAGVLVVFGLVPEEHENELVESYFVLIQALAVILGTLGFAVTTAWEDVARS